MKNPAKNKTRLKYSILYILALNLFIVINTSAQPKGRIVRSPIVNSDKSVTFKYIAPDAKQVILNGQMIEEDLPMTNDGTGLWTVTTKPVKPDIYPYCFIVDGIKVSDPGNEYIFANERFKYSLVDIPGDEPLIHSLQKVPHGDIIYCNYFSETLDMFRPLLIYTPPGYKKNTAYTA